MFVGRSMLVNKKHIPKSSSHLRDCDVVSSRWKDPNQWKGRGLLAILIWWKSTLSTSLLSETDIYICSRKNFTILLYQGIRTSGSDSWTTQLNSIVCIPDERDGDTSKQLHCNTTFSRPIRGIKSNNKSYVARRRSSFSDFPNLANSLSEDNTKFKAALFISYLLWEIEIYSSGVAMISNSKTFVAHFDMFTLAKVWTTKISNLV